MRKPMLLIVIFSFGVNGKAEEQESRIPATSGTLSGHITLLSSDGFDIV